MSRQRRRQRPRREHAISDSQATTEDAAASTPPPSIDRAVEPGLLGHLDEWMAASPWHPRLLPFLLYVVMLLVVEAGRELSLWLYPPLYVAQCGLALWLIWRYRRLIPELTLHFHWLVIPVTLVVVVVWVALGRLMIAWDPVRFAPDAQAMHYFEEMPRPLYLLSMTLRLLGMSLIVPLLEEPLVRSLLLRSTARARPTGVALIQLLEEVPILGDRLVHSRLGRWADQQHGIMEREFHANPLGTVTLFGVVLSTAVFCSYHVPRDWPASIFCGVAWCLLVALTAHRGLGPVIWSHALVNALLFAYVAYSGDWFFL